MPFSFSFHIPILGMNLVENVIFQPCTLKFIIAFLSDYPKYLIKSKHFKENNMNENDINNMIDINSYLNSINVSEKEFYKKIFKTKSFKEFILKRNNPKNSLEKIEAIFFEEKINEYIADNKVFGKNKIREQNKLLLSKEYDYISEPEIIDLSIQNLKNEYRILIFIFQLYNKFFYKIKYYL